MQPKTIEAYAGDIGGSARTSITDQLLELVASLPPCLIGMEACSGAHHWARQFVRFGHTVRLMAPKFVAPYRMSGKRDKHACVLTLVDRLSGFAVIKKL